MLTSPTEINNVVLNRTKKHFAALSRQKTELVGATSESVIARVGSYRICSAHEFATAIRTYVR